MFNAIDRIAIRLLSERFAVPYAWVLALTEVESAGRAFWSVKGKSLPAINLEGHYFYRNLPEGKRAQAVRLGLANPKMGKTKVPNSYAARYDMLDKWRAIDNDAALMSISMGVGQVMGEHATRLGFNNVTEMWDMACSSLAGQVELMLRFIAASPALVAAIAAKKYKVVARIYNGPKYAINAYDKKIKAAVLKYEGNASASPTNDTSAEQAKIKALGYASVEAFQQANGLVPDGIIGNITRDAIETAIKVKNAATAGNVTKVVVGAGAGGASVVVAGAEVAQEMGSVLDQAQPVLSFIQTLGQYGPTIVLVGVAALVIGLTVYFIVKKTKAA